MTKGMNQNQLVKLEWSMAKFERNIELMKGETEEEIMKVLKAGVSAYSTSMQKHTPPNLGKAKIDPLFYSDGFWYSERDTERVRNGRRPVYDLVSLARSDSRYRSYYGTLARQGWRYMVLIHRAGKPMKRIFCRTEAEAAAAAHETFRGITRAAWGLNIPSLSGKLPPAFRDLIRQRPKISDKDTGSVQLDARSHTVAITNTLVGGSYFSTADTNASIAAMRTMTDMMDRYFQKRRAL